MQSIKKLARALESLADPVEYNKQIYIIEIKLVHSYDRYEEVRSEGAVIDGGEN